MSDSLSGPLEMVRYAFEDADPDQPLGSSEFSSLMDSIVLQSVADGRITVLISQDVCSCTLSDIVDLFTASFQQYPVPIQIQVGKETFFAGENAGSIPESASSVTVSVLGYFNCSATFGFIDDPTEGFPSLTAYPLLCVGFMRKSESPKLRRDFEQFVRNREFPVRQMKGIYRQRTQLESRNRDYLLQTAKARKDLKQRYTSAKQTLEKKNRQLAVICEQLDGLEKTDSAPRGPRRLDKIEETIASIDGQINELVDMTERLSDMVDEKANGKQMTRREELALLTTLKKQVTDSRQQLEALKEQTQ